MEYYLLGFNPMLSDSSLMFWKNKLPPYTGLKSTGKPSKQPVRSILLNPEDGGNMFLQNFSELLPDYMMLYPRRYNAS
jgi:hypothetical protein